MNNLQLIAGGIGVDLVTGTDEFPARLGKIGLIVSNADASRIASIKYLNAKGTEIAVTSMSYVGAVDFNDNKTIRPDFPLTKITLSAGSVWVVYVNS